MHSAVSRSAGVIEGACHSTQNLLPTRLDIEGLELAILRSFPFDEFACPVLTVAHNRLPVREDIERFLAAHDYERVAIFDIDDCYVGKGDRHGVRHASAAWTRLGRGKRRLCKSSAARILHSTAPDEQRVDRFFAQPLSRRAE